jgi:hypothetical protein
MACRHETLLLHNAHLSQHRGVVGANWCYPDAPVGGTIINWMSKTQASVTLLSIEAEYGSLASGATQVKFVQQLLEEIVEYNTPGIILEDNTGAIFLVKNQQVGSRTKHIVIQFHYIREMREQGEVNVLFI